MQCFLDPMPLEPILTAADGLNILIDLILIFSSLKIAFRFSFVDSFLNQGHDHIRYRTVIQLC